MKERLLKAMSEDMGIESYSGESPESFDYRVCYSALGQWCLRLALSSDSAKEVTGTSKINMTNTLNELLEHYCLLFPHICDKFIKKKDDIKSTWHKDDDSVNENDIKDFSLHLRNVYLETGYLTEDSDKERVTLTNKRRYIKINNSPKRLFFGIPRNMEVNGLGVYANNSGIVPVPVKDFLIRDNLTCEQYCDLRFDEGKFNEDIDCEELEFFDPKKDCSPSKSWTAKKEDIIRKKITRTLARDKNGSYYRVKLEDGKLLFAEDPCMKQGKSFTSYEYRRLQNALKEHNGKPLKAKIQKKRDKYSTVWLDGHLPNREYYYMLLLSWPMGNAFCKTDFLFRNEFQSEIESMLRSIYITIQYV